LKDDDEHVIENDFWERCTAEDIQEQLLDERSEFYK
jgi:hypothetical protein